MVLPTLHPPSQVVPYFAPINPALFSSLWIMLLVAGLFFTGSFFVYETSVAKNAKRNAKREIFLAVVSSLFLGFGFVFLMLWSGVWL